MSVLKDSQMVLLQIISPNNVSPNVPLRRMIHLQKIHHTFVCNNAQWVALEVHRTCTVFKIVGGRIMQMIQQDSAYKLAHLDTLPKTKLLGATETATPTLTLTLQLVVALKNVQLCTSYSSMMKHGPV